MWFPTLFLQAQRINDGFGQREVIEESARDRFVNSASWGKVKRTEKWTADETTLFYDVCPSPLLPGQSWLH